jgi:glycosyltransferase involved in cell wall biosynthesis
LRKTVLFAINYLGRGGAESHTLRVLNYLDRERFRPLLAVAAKGGNYEPFLRPDVPIEPISIGTWRSSSTRQLLSAPGLRRVVQRERPDVVLTVMDLMSVLGIPTLLSLGARRPKIVPVVQIPPSIEYSRSRFGRSFVLPGVRHLYAHADQVIALSHGVAADLVRLDARLEGRITVIHNACVDERIESTDEAPVEEQSSAPVVLGAGRLLPQKGFEHLIDAFAEVRKSVEAELWIIGEGPDREQLQQRIARHGLGSSARLLGFKSNPHSYMRRATVFCLSSIYEGFGNVVVEAMACGAPVVSTDCPHGPSEIIRDESEGLLVPSRDPRALADALVRALKDEPLRARMSAGGRRRAQNFHARTIAAAYADELDRLLSSSSRR